MIFTERFTLNYTLAFVLVILTAQLARAEGAKVDERKTMRDARVAFEKKDFRRSISLYAKIPATSDYWPESLEERAWALVHVKEHDQALALVKTLTAPPVKSEIGAEPYLLSALVQLRLCDYDELFKVMKRFKADVKPRYDALKELAKSGKTVASEKFLTRSMELGQMSRTAAGPELGSLPRLVYRDAKIQSAFKDMLKPGSSDRHARIVGLRLKALAARDVKDLDTILRKFHLIEVEAVSRMYSNVHLADGKSPAAEIKRDANTLVFPDDAEDVWLDELDNYHVNAKGCPAAKTAAVTGKGPKS